MNDKGPETIVHHEDIDGDLFMVEGPFPDGYRFSVNGQRVTVTLAELREMRDRFTEESVRHSRGDYDTGSSIKN